MAKDLFLKYIWLVNTVDRAREITLEEIRDEWLRNDLSEGVEIAVRTFHNHRKAILDTFGIEIACRRNGNVYYIENAGEFKSGNIRTWLINTFAVNNLINESHEIKNRILFEEIPSGQKHLTPIIEAMRDNLCLKITYQSFRRDEPSTFEVEPYCVKIFKQRWYMLARSPYYDRLMIYSLDRIKDIEKAGKKFKFPKKFDPEKHFDDNYGIIIEEDINPCIIEIKANSDKRKYLETLPLHTSQTEKERTDEYSVFQYYVRPTYDFAQEILSHGSEIEVLSPPDFRNEIAETVRRMSLLYPEKK
ncbi:MAG: WYL domain-containing protein [Prevotellaceae bacterium]|jgi:predicted DNA-binding transcriptional regulator YafY|nr:WYL domain-containing protein [Prevotellaceae bacterium]